MNTSWSDIVFILIVTVVTILCLAKPVSTARFFMRKYGLVPKLRDNNEVVEENSLEYTRNLKLAVLIVRIAGVLGLLMLLVILLATFYGTPVP
ncbi:MAG: hypothetical protein EXR62_10085 [Chloroflexi bacterium]|nr:hypothetical protein [Chloroflexota bacterium]